MVGLYDLGEQDVFRRGLARSRSAHPGTRTDLEQLGFYCCVNDLEDS
ncbi:MAG TPA: hypothetical protein VGX25_05970 [Actinophytocola sp.]|nr:hypothetical protein [Actinophytocola sp.]HEV2778932.1 hypothetical protein [Actinophytocola sp.]